MEKNIKFNKKVVEEEVDEEFQQTENFAEQDDMDYEEFTSHKIDKNVMDQKKKKRLIVIIEQA
jgi:hypothetical protein